MSDSSSITRSRCSERVALVNHHRPGSVLGTDATQERRPASRWHEDRVAFPRWPVATDSSEERGEVRGWEVGAP
jgi:hypothetical protein